MPSGASPAMLPKTTVNITVVRNGWIIAHAGPSTVCLYCAVKLRLTNRKIKSLYASSSPKCRSNQPFFGRMTVVNFSSINDLRVYIR